MACRADFITRGLISAACSIPLHGARAGRGATQSALGQWPGEANAFYLKDQPRWVPAPQIFPLVLSFWKSALVNNGSCQWSEELTQSCLCRLASFLRVPVFWWIARSQSPQIVPVAPWHFFPQWDSSLPSNLLPLKPCVYNPGALTKLFITRQLVGECHSWGYWGSTQEIACLS